MKIKKGDKIIVITGKDKGKQGNVTKVLKKSGKIVVEKVNLATKHVKKTDRAAGERIKIEKPIDVSNVMLICPQTSKRTRVGYKILQDGTKVRYCKASDYILDQKS